MKGRFAVKSSNLCSPDFKFKIECLGEFSLRELLGREPIKVNCGEIGEFLKGKRVLVSGGAGSIGSETVRQLLKFSPKRVVVVDIDETELYYLWRELQDSLENPEQLEVVVGDIRDYEKVEEIFSSERPQIVFHAAAYKHVPLMEKFPEEAVKTNVIGTYNMIRAACTFGVEKFVNISTDKACNPKSIMGATKRITELLCAAFNGVSPTAFISVRFANVFGSRGSVVPIFIEQIKKGGPITITHPKAERSFMAIGEAVLLIFQAAAIGKGGEIFGLNAEKSLTIVELAKRLAGLFGLEVGRDIEIVFTGLRPGERLTENHFRNEEGARPTEYKGIFVAELGGFSVDEAEEIVEELIRSLRLKNRELLKAILKKCVDFCELQEAALSVPFEAEVS